MKAVTLNRPALWRPIRSSEISVRKYGGGYPYQTKSGLTAQSSTANPVIRYAKNFKKFGEDFSLFVFSDETDQSAIESFLESTAKKVKKSEVMRVLATPSISNFTYLDVQYGGTA